MAREWRIARRDDKPLTLALFDVDALGSYNATFGRPAGMPACGASGRHIAGVFRRGH